MTNFLSSLYILEISSLSDVVLVKIFSHSVGCRFVFVGNTTSLRAWEIWSPRVVPSCLGLLIRRFHFFFLACLPSLLPGNCAYSVAVTIVILSWYQNLSSLACHHGLKIQGLSRNPSCFYHYIVTTEASSIVDWRACGFSASPVYRQPPRIIESNAINHSCNMSSPRFCSSREPWLIYWSFSSKTQW